MKTTMAMNEEVSTLFDRLNYDTLSASNTIATLIESGKDADILKSDLFKQYDHEYMLKFMEYDFAKQDLSRRLLEQHKDENVVINWTVTSDFSQIDLDIVEDKEEIKEKISIDVSEDDINLLQNLYYTVEAKRAIIIKIFDRHKSDVDASELMTLAAFKEYRSQLTKAERDYDKEKERISNLLIPGCLQNHTVKWSFDFMNNIFNIYIKCDCGVQAYHSYLNNHDNTENIECNCGGNCCAQTQC